jgi:hypothetical protein
MLKLKKIDLLAKNDKIHNKLLGERMLWPRKKSIKNLSACVEKRGRVVMGVWLQFRRGELGWGRRKGRRMRNRGRERRQSGYIYIGNYWWNHRRKFSVGIPVDEFAGDCATSLYGDPGLNPSIIPSVKSSEKNTRHHTVATFQKNTI